MRTYEILDDAGNISHTQEMDDSLAPVLVAGQSARLLAVDGERLAKASRVAVGPDAPPAPDVAELETEAAAAEKRAAAAKSHSDLRDKAAKATSREPKGSSREAAAPADPTA